MPGKMVPLFAIPLLREDRLRMSRFRISYEMLETAEVLMNPVNVNVKAYLVPNLALDRFNGIDQLNRSYAKQPETDGGTVTPFIRTATAGAYGTNPILLAMGKHMKQGTVYNMGYEEAYNEIWNFRATNRSGDITLRATNDTSLAPAFWQHQQWAHIVPDFDQALIDGEVPLNVVQARLPVSGIARTGTNLASEANLAGTTVPGAVPGPWAHGKRVQDPRTAMTAGHMELAIKTTDAAGATPDVWAELAENGITVSLSNIELARKTQAFAALKKQYAGVSDQYIVDMLMNGLTVPEQAWRQPILLADRSTIFGQSKRYATTADDLTASVANGGTFIDINIGTPVVPMGGVIMVICEVTPEQLFERQMDPYLWSIDQALWPEFLRDTLDPEKVEVVPNARVDVYHATPTATFGYEPLNARWNQAGPIIGGKFFRPVTDGPVDEVRQRIWAVETLNPTLSRDFYLCTTMHTKPFVVTNQDPFECVTRGLGIIDGLTVFGNLLIEGDDEYEEIMAEAPMDRIDLPETLEEIDSGQGQGDQTQRRGEPNARIEAARAAIEAAEALLEEPGDADEE